MRRRRSSISILVMLVGGFEPSRLVAPANRIDEDSSDKYNDNSESDIGCDSEFAKRRSISVSIGCRLDRVLHMPGRV